jgi:radical SAM-linked protein
MSVGMESVAELVDIYLKRDEENPEEPVITPEEFAKRLSKILPNGLEIVSASFPEKDFSQIESADYTITLVKNDSAWLSDFIKNAFLSPVEILKKTKSGEKLVNISPLVFSVSTEENDKECRVFARLSAKPNEYLSPDLFVKALCQYDNVNSIDSWQVIREKINFKES